MILKGGVKFDLFNIAARSNPQTQGWICGDGAQDIPARYETDHIFPFIQNRYPALSVAQDNARNAADVCDEICSGYRGVHHVRCSSLQHVTQLVMIDTSRRIGPLGGLRPSVTGLIPARPALRKTVQVMRPPQVSRSSPKRSLVGGSV